MFILRARILLFRMSLISRIVWFTILCNLQSTFYLVRSRASFAHRTNFFDVISKTKSQ